jgi:hypothetical protein
MSLEVGVALVVLTMNGSALLRRTAGIGRRPSVASMSLSSIGVDE